MPVDVRIPTLGESVTEGVILRWIRANGDAVVMDEALLELETDKTNVELPSPGAGVLEILKQEGEKVQVGEVVARLVEGSGKTAPAKPAAAAAPSAPPVPAPAASNPTAEVPQSPAVRRLVEEKSVDPTQVEGTGRGGRLTKGDVLAHLEAKPVVAAPPAAAPAAPAAAPVAKPTPVAKTETAGTRVPMSNIRKRIAERLVQAQHTAAILTTFNEIDMSALLALRARHKQRFAERHGVGLGFMSFFGKAVLAALHDVPVVGARLEGTDIVYPPQVNLGVAVGTDRGLVVPVVHGADRMSFAAIEKEIERLAGLARQNKLAIDDLSGGTFTISNGGVYGSLLSTPILNPPQSGILGMHKTEKRPVVVDDQIVIRPMMYVALSYDHRLVDGKEAVTFLVRVKESIEDPSRLLLDI